jgi:hypothetical protein
MHAGTVGIGSLTIDRGRFNASREDLVLALRFQMLRRQPDEKVFSVKSQKVNFFTCLQAEE